MRALRRLAGFGAFGLWIAASGAAAECEPHVEESADGRTAQLRTHTDALEDCSLDEERYVAVVSAWWAARRDAAPPESLFLGRAVKLPWLSEAIVRAALTTETLPPAGDPGSMNRWLASSLSADPLRGRLAAPFAGSPIDVASVQVEKVLIDEVGDLLGDPSAGSRRVPFDAQVWLVLRGEGASPAEATTPIPGTKVALEIPQGFELAGRFSGLLHEETGASIMVSELPTAAARVTSGFTAERLLLRGMVLTASGEVTISDRPAQLLQVTQEAEGTTFHKWMAAFGSNDATVLLVATYPAAVAERFEQPLRLALLSARWDPEREIDPFEGLPFRLTESARLKVEKRVQNLILLEPPGRDPKQVEQPFVVVGSAISPVQARDLELFAKQRLARTAEIKELEIVEGHARTIAGRNAYVIEARAKDHSSGRPLGLYQMMLFADDTYFLVQAMVGEALWDDYLPEFEQIAASLELR